MINNKLTAILLISCLISGCKSLFDADKVHPTMKEVAQETIDLSDFYLQEISSGLEAKISRDEMRNLAEVSKEAMEPKLSEQFEIYKQIKPELKGKMLQRTDACAESLSVYTIAYQGLLLQLNVRLLPIEIPINTDLESTDDLPLYKAKAIQDCDL